MYDDVLRDAYEDQLVELTKLKDQVLRLQTKVDILRHKNKILNAQILHEQRYNKEYHDALMAMELAGWPCRLVELPELYVLTATEYAKICAQVYGKSKGS